MVIHLCIVSVNRKQNITSKYDTLLFIDSILTILYYILYFTQKIYHTNGYGYFFKS